MKCMRRKYQKINERKNRNTYFLSIKFCNKYTYILFRTCAGSLTCNYEIFRHFTLFSKKKYSNSVFPSSKNSQFGIAVLHKKCPSIFFPIMNRATFKLCEITIFLIYLILITPRLLEN